MEISTNRLTLRRLKPEDVSDEYVGWLMDPEVSHFLETKHSVQTEQSVREFVASKAASSNEFLFGIFLADGGRHIGNIKVGPIHAYHRFADVSLLIGARDCWGKGYASEAIAGVSRYAFSELRVRKLCASMYDENLGSYNAFLKAGYREEGRRRSQALLDDVPHDQIEVGALPGEIT